MCLVAVSINFYFKLKKGTLVRAKSILVNFSAFQPLQSPNELLEQGRAIVHSSSGISRCEIPSFVTLKDQNNVAAAKVTDNPQERRPGLGRKRARFSLKPKSRYKLVVGVKFV